MAAEGLAAGVSKVDGAESGGGVAVGGADAGSAEVGRSSDDSFAG